MNLLIRFLMCFFVLTLFSCIWHSVEDVSLNYLYSKPTNLEFSRLTDKSITVKEVKDCREVENQRIIMYKTDGYGAKTTGGHQAEKPLASIIKDALVDALKVSGLTYSDEVGNLSLSGDLLDVDHNKIIGTWKVTLQTEIMVKFTLKDEDKDKILWRETYTGRSSVKIKNEFNPDPTEGFTAALDDLFEQIFSDEMFLEQLRKNLIENTTRM